MKLIDKAKSKAIMLAYDVLDKEMKKDSDKTLPKIIKLFTDNDSREESGAH